jgi:hypothetical protein
MDYGRLLIGVPVVLGRIPVLRKPERRPYVV